MSVSKQENTLEKQDEFYKKKMSISKSCASKLIPCWKSLLDSLKLGKDNLSIMFFLIDDPLRELEEMQKVLNSIIRDIPPLSYELVQVLDFARTFLHDLSTTVMRFRTLKLDLHSIINETSCVISIYSLGISKFSVQLERNDLLYEDLSSIIKICYNKAPIQLLDFGLMHVLDFDSLMKSLIGIGIDVRSIKNHVLHLLNRADTCENYDLPNIKLKISHLEVNDVAIIDTAPKIVDIFKKWSLMVDIDKRFENVLIEKEFLENKIDK